MYRSICLAIIGCTFFAGAVAQDLVPVSTEEIIVSHVDEETTRALALLETTVNINSGTMNLDGVRAVGRIFSAELDEIGFSTEWIDGTPVARAGHLVAHRGDRGPKILLIGHLDTVFAVDSPFQKYAVVDEHYAAGPGTTDMKGGDVIIIHALRALQAAGVLDDISIKVVMTGDEEMPGRPLEIRSAALLEAAKWADYAIGFEDGDSNPKTAVIARRGTTTWTLSTSGARAHSSQIFQPDYGDGAIYEAARILNAFREELSAEPNLSFNPGTILGGTIIDHDDAASSGTAFGKTNIISGVVRVRGDLRTISLAQRETVKKRMQEIVAQHLPVTGASIEFTDGYPPMAPSDGNYALLKLFDQTSRDLGFGEVAAVNPRKAGAADISFAADYVEMAMDGVGLMGSGGHTLDEVADLRTLSMQTKRVAVLLYRLSQQQ